jgi:hypothetical protein
MQFLNHSFTIFWLLNGTKYRNLVIHTLLFFLSFFFPPEFGQTETPKITSFWLPSFFLISIFDQISAGKRKKDQKKKGCFHVSGTPGVAILGCHGKK